MAIRNNQLGGSDFNYQETNLQSADLNDTNNIISKLLVNQAELTLRTIRDASIYNNLGRNCGDIFTSSAGKLTTVDTISSDTNFETDGYILGLGTDEASGDSTYTAGAVVNETNCFDGDDVTFGTATLASGSSTTTGIGKTWASPKTISYIKIIASYGYSSSSSHYTSAKLMFYDGSVWSIYKSYEVVLGMSSKNIDEIVYPSESIRGIALEVTDAGGANGTGVLKLNTLEYGQNFSSSSNLICNSNLPSTDGTEKSIVVTSTYDLPANTSLDFDISDGTTTLSNQSFNTPINISSFTTGNLTLTFNLSTTDTTVSPKVYDYAISILK